MPQKAPPSGGAFFCYCISHIFCILVAGLLTKFKTMLFKSASQEIKGLDEKEGIVEAYANVYNVEDSDGDISAQGSFKRTVENNFKRFRVLKDHISTISLGVPVKVDADDPYGLKTVTQFNLNKEVSRDMFSDIQLYMEAGLNAELSIGYEIVKRSKTDQKVVEEYKLYEYSFLTGWAANAMAITEGVKSIQTKEGIIELITKAYESKRYSYHSMKWTRQTLTLRTLTRFSRRSINLILI